MFKRTLLRQRFVRSSVLLAGAGGAAVVASPNASFDPLSLTSYTEPVRFSAIATARSSRVVSCALLCFKDYRTALTGDEQDLSKCHSKCATRVLKVLEKNGGIYIKLGQHIAAMSYLLPSEWTQTMMVFLMTS